MKNTMKKILTLVLAGLMAAAAVVSVSAGNVLTDKDLANQGDLTGGYIIGWYPGWKPESHPNWWYPSFGDLEDGILNKDAKCPTCSRACYQYVNITGSNVGFIYLCTVHGIVTPTLPVPPAEDEKPAYGDYEIRTSTTRGGQITFNNNDPIQKYDSRTVYITPDYGYICVGVYLDGRYVGVVDKLQLKYICADHSVVAFFEAVNTKRDNAVIVETTGNGTVTGKLNGKNAGEIGTTAIKYKDTLTLKFNASKNYTVESVRINGVEMGPLASYTLEKLYYDVKIEVSYKWNNPWVDVDTHLTAVEYVTENGIMGSPNQFMNTDEFQGEKKVNNYLLCAFLAEMADEADVLDTNKERAEWAKKMGVVDENTNMSMRPTYAEAAEIVMNFLRVVEKEWDITFTDLKGVTDAKEVAKEIGLYNAKTYETGRPCRYDVAEICCAIAQLDAE
ncbi:MAG: hypothetical protein IJ325_00645 [Clostridia bacterium]|nr:hypothetical protein [Clostridia bacterium]